MQLRNYIWPSVSGGEYYTNQIDAHLTFLLEQIIDKSILVNYVEETMNKSYRI